MRSSTISLKNMPKTLFNVLIVKTQKCSYAVLRVRAVTMEFTIQCLYNHIHALFEK